jgi:DNA helicase-2/ATP-dependent DNA helicase PcrA
LQLSPEQEQIINHEDGHAKVIAVAGAGKTTTLALFIQRRLEMGQNPRRLLVIMYNKSAQLDFSSKLTALLPNAQLPQVRTFHALGLKIYHSLISEGILRPFKEDLISQSEQEYILWRLLQEHANKQTAQEILQDKKKWLDPMMSFMENVKSSLEPAELVFKQTGLPKNCAFFAKVFDAYENWRKENGRIGFSDMLYDPCQVFSARPDVAARFSNHMDWVLVDEYQDINPIQQFLLQTLAGTRSKVVVIGDPDQTIYEFRGSSAQFMLKHFDEHFKGVHRYTLSTTFRYGHDVALLSNQLILQNKQREDVICVAGDSNPDTQVSVHKHIDYAQQTLAVIKQAMTERPLEDIAVLLRLWGMSAPLELALLQEDIPYQMSHQSWVLQRIELQPIMMLLEIAAGVFSEGKERNRYQSWLTFLTFPAMKIKRADLQVVARNLTAYGDEIMPIFSQLAVPSLSKWQSQQLENRLSIVKLALNKRMMGFQLANCYIRETDFYKGVSDSAFSKQQVDDRLATVQGFVRFIARLNLSAGGTYEYLQELTQKRASQTNRQGIVLSSIHRAKGLQWPVVILPGLTSHFYPYQSEGELQAAASIESERRLFYVAMTRCIEQLHFITPTNDPSLSSPMAASQEISDFIQSMAIADILKIKAIWQKGGGDLQLSRRTLKSAQKYLDKLNWPVSLSAKALEKPDLKTAPKMSRHSVQGAVTSLELIEHSKFGKGRIKQETTRHWHILFDDGQLRVLDKEIASVMLRWL